MSRLISTISDRIKNRFQSGGLRPGFIFVIIVIIAFVMAAFVHNDPPNGTMQAQNVALAQGDPTLPPDFQFIGQGRITGGTESTWIIGGVPIHPDEHTDLMSDLHVGDFVTLTGRILQDGTWLADRIELIGAGESFFTFNGRLDWIRGSVWRIGGHALLVNLRTELGSNLGIGDTLMATFSVLESGAWLASRIVAFDKFPATPTPTATPTEAPQPTATPAPQPEVKPANDPAPASKPKNSTSGSVTVCHNPGNKKGGKTMTIDQAALQSHLNHGDSVGPCP
jgi:hypothetical protein